ncbi:MAG: hypothetical protein WD356_01205 [Pseudomonadales bacterium]
MNDRDYIATHTHVPWDHAIDVLRNAGINNPTVDEIVSARARIRYAEAAAMLALRED